MVPEEVAQITASADGADNSRAITVAVETLMKEDAENFILTYNLSTGEKRTQEIMIMKKKRNSSSFHQTRMMLMNRIELN